MEFYEVNKIIHIVEIKNNEEHRRCINPLDDYSNEPQELKDFADKLFTTKVKADYKKTLMPEKE